MAIYNRGSLTISGGTINGTVLSTKRTSTVTITGGTVNGTISSTYPSGVTITGGTFSEDPSEYLDSDHIAVLDGEHYVIANAIRVTVQSMEQTSHAEVATVSGGGAYAEGSEVTVKANSAAGYDFIGWYAKDGTGYSGDILSTGTTYTFTAEEDTDLAAVYKVSETSGKAELQVSGSEFRVNGGPIQLAYNYSQKYDLNTEITLEATGEDFLYWMNSSRKIMTTSREYSFTLVRSTTVTAVYKRAAEATAYVEFVSAYDQVIQAQNYSADSSITIPNGPSKAGYTFVSWDKTAEEIRSLISEGETYIRVNPVYEAMSGSYSLTVVYDGEAEEAEQLAGNQIYTLEAREIEGRKFAYWQDDWGHKLSTNETYKYMLNRDATIYAMYVDESEEAIEEPLITITNAKGIVDGGENKIQYTIIHDVPEGYTVLENGAVYGTSSRFGGEGGSELLVLDGEKTYNAVSNKNDRYGVYFFTYKVGSVVNRAVYVKGYMKVRNDETGVTETIYSDIIAKTYNDVA